MFSRKPNPRLVEVDLEISRVLAVMARIEPDSEEYAAATANWSKLCEERKELTSNRFTKDQMLVVAANVLIAGLVIGHERTAVITTNLHKFIGKAKS